MFELDRLKFAAATIAFPLMLVAGGATQAWGDVPANAPQTLSPLDPNSIVWDMNQEISALLTTRTLDPEFAAKGIPLGQGSPFRLYTNLGLSTSFDDNVYKVAPGVGPGPQSDFFFTESPTFVLDYLTGDLHLDAYADSTSNEYAKFSGVNNTEYDFGLKGIYVISRAVQLSANVSYSQDAEPLSSPNDVGFQARPTLYNDFNGNAVLKVQPNRLGFTVGFNTDTDTYQSTPLIGGGPNFDNSDRNDTTYKGFVEGDYDFSPGYESFVRATYNSDQYQQYFDRTGTHRSSTEDQFDAGVKLLLSNLIRGQIYVGYLDDHFDTHQANPLKDITGVDFGASVQWFPTELLTVDLAASRTITDTVLAGASGGDDRNVSLNADYEVTRRLHLTFNAAYDDTAYEGSVAPSNLSVDTTSVGLGGKWYIMHYVQATVAYTYSTRSSNAALFRYNDNLVTVGLNLQI